MNQITNKKHNQAFTIVELLVVIVVIGILTAIIIVSYSGITKRAAIATLESDLSNAAMKMKMYYTDNESYPQGIDCSAAPAANTICIKNSSNNVFSYAPHNNPSNPSFYLTALNTTGNLAYSLNNNSNPETYTNIITPMSPATISTNTPQTIAISPDGAFAYAGNSGTSTISMFSRNKTTGTLTPLGTPTIATNGPNVRSVVVSPDGNHVYAAILLNHEIQIYSRDKTTGLLTLVGSTYASEDVWMIRISSDGKSLYAVVSDVVTPTNTLSMYSRNATTGILTPLGTPTIATGSSPYTVAISPDGNYVYVGDAAISIYSRNTTTGLLTSLGTAGSAPGDIYMSPDGTSIYSRQYTAKTISMFSRNTTTGLLSPLGTPTIATADSPKAVQISPDGTSVYIALLGNLGTWYSRNPITGALTNPNTSSVATCNNPQEIAISPDGKSVYIPCFTGNEISQYTRN